MINSPNENASGEAGVNVDSAGGLEATKKNVFRCGVHRTSKLRRELSINGLALYSTSGQTQRQTLLRVLHYLGDRGINTLEGVACGFYRIATRIHELEEEGWHIASRRERLLGADGLVHDGVARYALMGRNADQIDRQGSLDLEVRP